MKTYSCGYNFRHDASYRADRPKGAGGYILMIIRSPARITLDGKDHFVKGNTVIVYRKTSPHIYGAHNAPFVNDWVRFYPDQKDLEYLSKIGIPFDTIIEYPDIHNLSDIIRLMAAECRSTSAHGQEKRLLLLQLLFLMLSDQLSKKTQVPAHLTEKLTDLRDNIYASPEHKWTIAGICQSLSISPSYLQHKYKKLFGNSIKSDITASRLEYGKYLLSTTDHTIRDISQMIGYENDVHFMYIFKKKTGITPTEYRNATATH